MLMKMWKLTLGNFYIKLALKFQLNILTLKRTIYLYLKNSILMPAAYFSIVVTWAEVLSMKCNLHKLVQGR